jgi:hypothetical protein
MTDVTIDHVKGCTGVTEEMGSKFIESGLKPVDHEPQWPASEKQIRYVMTLQNHRMLPEWWTAMTEAQLKLMERDEVSGIINMLKTFVEKKADDSSKAEYRDVPAGRYAIKEKTGLGEQWRFYEVQDGKGKWQGYKFIKRLIGAPGQYQKNPLSREARIPIMKVLESDPQKAMTDYGLQSGVCGKCSSPLSDPVSLARGIGPKCLAKLGW